MALYNANFDGKNLTDDWIYDDLAERGDYTANFAERLGKYNDIAFYRDGILFRAMWTSGENHLVITQLTYGSNALEVWRDIEEICTSCNEIYDGDMNLIVCNARTVHHNSITTVLTAEYYYKN